MLGVDLVGMVLTHQEWISDLWVLGPARRKGIGRKLLAQGEAEITSRGYRTFHLRVVKSNAVAVSFYQQHDWRVEQEFAHEKLPVTMLKMVKQSQRVATRPSVNSA